MAQNLGLRYLFYGTDDVPPTPWNHPPGMVSTSNGSIEKAKRQAGQARTCSSFRKQVIDKQ